MHVAVDLEQENMELKRKLMEYEERLHQVDQQDQIECKVANVSHCYDVFGNYAIVF